MGVKGAGLFLWETRSSKFKYKTEKHPNLVSLAMVELGLLIAVQKWDHSSAAMAERHRRAKGKRKTCRGAMGETWTGAGVGPGRADKVLYSPKCFFIVSFQLDVKAQWVFMA